MDENDYSKEDLETAKETIVELGSFFQIIPEKKKEIDEKMVENLMNLLIELRQRFRDEKSFEASDEIRRELQELGITLEDTTEGIKWRIKAQNT
jgi:cysteinyl-tRNA synthetase